MEVEEVVVAVTSKMPACAPSSSSSPSERDSGDDVEKPEDAVSDRTVDAGEASSCCKRSLSTLTVQGLHTGQSTASKNRKKGAECEEVG